MAIPTNFTAPNLPTAEQEYKLQAQERFRSILRLYFTLLDNQNRVANEQAASAQTLLWLGM